MDALPKGESILPSFSETKRNELTKSIALLTEQYAAVSNQLRLELDASRKVLLQEKLNDLEAQIAYKQQELDELGGKPAGAIPIAAPTVTLPDKQTLYDLLYHRFNVNEFKDLYYRLGIDVESVASSYNRQEMARELVEYCARHGISHQLVETVNALRPGLIDSL